jgi:hypothetical protein
MELLAVFSFSLSFLHDLQLSCYFLHGYYFSSLFSYQYIASLFLPQPLISRACKIVRNYTHCDMYALKYEF